MKKQNLLAKIEQVLLNISAFVFVIMVILVFISVLLRYFFAFSLTWAEELTRYMMIFISLFGAALAIESESHIGFVSFVNRYPEKMQVYFKITIYLLMGTFAAVMAYKGFFWAFSSGSRGQILPIPMSIPLSIVPFSSTLMFVILLNKIIKLVRGRN